jgi:hypothetical protein
MAEKGAKVIALKGGTQAIGGLIQYVVGHIRSCGYALALDNEAAANDAEEGETGQDYIERKVEEALPST